VQEAWDIDASIHHPNFFFLFFHGFLEDIFVLLKVIFLIMVQSYSCRYYEKFLIIQFIKKKNELNQLNDDMILFAFQQLRNGR